MCGSPSSFRETSLNARPLGSMPTCLWTRSSPISSIAAAYINGFTQDWMEKSTSVSPMSNRWPSTVHTEMPNQLGSASSRMGMYDALAPPWTVALMASYRFSIVPVNSSQSGTARLCSIACARNGKVTGWAFHTHHAGPRGCARE